MSASVMGEKEPHLPVLYQEIIHAIQPRAGGFYVDGTVGAGGHAAGLLQGSSPDGRLLGLDLDDQALALARLRLETFGDRAVLIKASYTTLEKQHKALGWPPVNGVVLDFGVSSMQLDTPARGFSFQVDAPLDMRFDPANPVSAGELVNHLPEDELADLIYRYGEEHKSRQVARAIVQARPLHTTRQLAELLVRVVGRPAKRTAGIHPATRTFQALRIAVNGELDAIGQVLPQAVAVLASGGRLAVISFHSLEDRLVKQYFRQESQDCICPPRQPVCTCGHQTSIRELARHPLQAQAAEIGRNPRSRSAKMRVVEKV